MNRRLASILFLLLSFAGCQRMDAREHGVIFSSLPVWLGGGVRNKVVAPGEVTMLMPWERIYRVDTTIRSIGWGGVGQGTVKNLEDYVEARSLDGNEVGLAITIQYRVDADKVQKVVENVGPSTESIDRLVATVARADIRTHMNILRTPDFFSPEKRENAVQQVKESLRRRLGAEGIIIRDVIYNDHLFERRLPDGTVDRSYQEQIDRTQTLRQETQQEEKKVASVVEQKRREFNEKQAIVNRQIEEAEGFRQQATLRGDAYLLTKKNDAEQVNAVGMADVEGLKKQIEALKGPGGRAILRLQIVKELLSNQPKFILMNSSGQGNSNLDFTRIDANELMRQAGVFVSTPEMEQKSAPAVPKAPTLSTAPAARELVDQLPAVPPQTNAEGR